MIADFVPKGKSVPAELTAACKDNENGSIVLVLPVIAKAKRPLSKSEKTYTVAGRPGFQASVCQLEGRAVKGTVQLLVDNPDAPKLTDAEKLEAKKKAARKLLGLD